MTENAKTIAERVIMAVALEKIIAKTVKGEIQWQDNSLGARALYQAFPESEHGNIYSFTLGRPLTIAKFHSADQIQYDLAGTELETKLHDAITQQLAMKTAASQNSMLAAI